MPQDEGIATATDRPTDRQTKSTLIEPHSRALGLGVLNVKTSSPSGFGLSKTPNAARPRGNKLCISGCCDSRSAPASQPKQAATRPVHVTHAPELSAGPALGDLPRGSQRIADRTGANCRAIYFRPPLAVRAACNRPLPAPHRTCRRRLCEFGRVT